MVGLYDGVELNGAVALRSGPVQGVLTKCPADSSSSMVGIDHEARAGDVGGGPTVVGVHLGRANNSLVGVDSDDRPARGLQEPYSAGLATWPHRRLPARPRPTGHRPVPAGTALQIHRSTRPATDPTTWGDELSGLRG